MTAGPRRVRRAVVPCLIALLVIGSGAVVASVGSPGGRGPSTGTAPAASATASSGVQPFVCAGTLAIRINATPSSGIVPLTVNFASNVTGGCPPYEIEWEFGDGGEYPGASPMHVFQSAGTWQVLAQVSDSGGHEASTNLTVTVNGGPGALKVAVAASVASGPAPLGVTFWANVSGGNLTGGYTTSWRFGDGGTGQGAIVAHVYRVPGAFTATATVRPALGGQVSGSTGVSVGPSVGGGPANLSLTATPSDLNAPGDVVLTAYSHGPAGPYNLSVCFGDGSACAFGPAAWNGTDPVVFEHEYLTPGNYSILGTLANATGTILAGASAAVVVRAGSGLFLETSSTPLGGEAPLPASFQATVLGGTPPYTVRWTFGDGTVGSSVPGVPVTHVYGLAGTFTAVVLVQDAAGHSNSSTLPAIVVRTAGGGFLPAEVLGVPSLDLLVILIVAAVGVGVLVGRWSVRRARVRQLRKEGEEIVRELEREG